MGNRARLHEDREDVFGWLLLGVQRVASARDLGQRWGCVTWFDPSHVCANRRIPLEIVNKAAGRVRTMQDLLTTLCLNVLYVVLPLNLFLVCITTGGGCMKRGGRYRLLQPPGGRVL